MRKRLISSFVMDLSQCYKIERKLKKLNIENMDVEDWSLRLPKGVSPRRWPQRVSYVVCVRGVVRESREHMYDPVRS